METTMFLHEPPETAEAAALYSRDLAGGGYVMNLTRLWAWRPEVSDAFARTRALLLEKSSLSSRERAVLICATARGLGDSYCSIAWGSKLAKESDPSVAGALLRGEDSQAITPREQALAQWVATVVEDPNASTRDDVERLRAAGLSEKEIFEATVLIAFRLAFSTVNDALGALPDAQLAAAAPAEVRDAVDFGRPVARSV